MFSSRGTLRYEERGQGYRDVEKVGKHCPRGKGARYTLNKGLVNPRAGWMILKKKNPLSLPEIESRFVPTTAKSLYRLSYPGWTNYTHCIWSFQ